MSDRTTTDGADVTDVTDEAGTDGAGAGTAGLPVSGRQAVLRHGGYEAAVAGVGASLRVLRHEGRDLVRPFEADELRPVFSGALLAPWPNRVVDGRWTSEDGVEHQLALSEPDRGHALHGLLGWVEWTLAAADGSSATFVAETAPSDGYPYRVAVEATFELADDGLTTTVAATNVGAGRAPWGTGPHPYLVAGEGRVDDWTLRLPADRYLEVTDDRLAPLEVRDVTAREGFDFREPRRVGDLFVDHAFTGLVPDAGGATVVELTAPDGRGVRMTSGPELPWVQVHTADRPEPGLDRTGLAVEPMTCPPDALNSGTDLVVLDPGASHVSSWTIAAI